MKRAIVFQHIELEDLGFLYKLLKKNFEITYVKLFENQKIPLNLKIYDLIFSLG